MDKILVEIEVPIMNRSYDMFIPATSPMYEVLELIKKAVFSISDGQFLPQVDTVLCYQENGEIIDINKFVCELNVTNGTKLVLI